MRLRIKVSNIMRVHWKIRFLVGFTNNKYIGLNCLKRGRGLENLEIYLFGYWYPNTHVWWRSLKESWGISRLKANPEHYWNYRFIQKGTLLLNKAKCMNDIWYSKWAMNIWIHSQTVWTIGVLYIFCRIVLATFFPLKLKAFVDFYIFHQKKTRRKLWEILFIVPEKLFSFLRYSDFWTSSLSFLPLPSIAEFTREADWKSS